MPVSAKKILGFEGLAEPYNRLNPADRRTIKTQAIGFAAVLAAMVLGGGSIYYAATRQPSPHDTVAGIIDDPSVIRELAAAVRRTPQDLPEGMHRFQCHTAGRAAENIYDAMDVTFIFLCYIPGLPEEPGD